jgi:murein DD-endopeptidase MepM/ murein hydrolase activator NlpD
MMMWFEKWLIVSISGLICVSCAIPPVYPPNPISTIPQPQPAEVNKQLDSAPTTSFPVQPVVPLRQYPIVKPPRLQSPSETPLKRVVRPPVAQLPTFLQSLSLRKKSTVPGGIVLVPLQSQSIIAPQIIYNKRQVATFYDGRQWFALVGVPLKAKIGWHTIIEQQTQKRYSFQVKPKTYKTQRIKLKNKRLVNPTRKDLRRIRSEHQQIRAALASPWRMTSTSPLPLTQPVHGRFSSPFGLRRFFNGQRRNPHSGLDIAISQGTPVVAAATGKVVNTGHYFYTGKTIIIEHGLGIVTLYGHLNRIQVSTGQTVRRGQTIGTVGKTGRATGPHLHWGVSLNNTMINPMLVTQ